MKRPALAILLLAVLLLPVGAPAQVELLDYPSCATVGEWDPPGAVRAGSAENGILVTWTPAPTEPFQVEGYEISRAPDLEGPYEPIALIDVGLDRYVDESTLPDTFYWYRVRSYREGLCSPLSQPVRGSRP